MYICVANCSIEIKSSLKKEEEKRYPTSFVPVID